MVKSNDLTKPQVPNIVLYLLGAGILLRIILSSTLGLSDDEAWYWALAQKIQWSYVVHPPLSVWMIFLSTKIFGNHELAVRLPAILSMVLGTYWLVRLACAMGYRQGSFVVVLLGLTSPLLLLGGILVGPDLPLFLFWAGMMEVSYKLSTTKQTSVWSWVRLGLFAGGAALSKYTAFIALPIILLCLLSTPLGRAHLKGAGPWIAMLVALFIFSPVIVWNGNHQWVSFRFQFIDRHNNEHINWGRWGLFWLSQLGLMGPALFFGWFHLVKNTIKQNQLFLALWALLPGMVFFVQPLFSSFKIHWAVFAFIPAMVYGAKFLNHRPLIQNTKPKFLVYGAVFSCLLTTFGVCCLYVPLAPGLFRIFTKQELDPRHDITNDFYGWDSFARSWRQQSLYIQTMPLVTNRYQVAAQAAYALRRKDNVHIIPHASAEVKDWGEDLDHYPKEFLYIADNRYKDNPQEAFPGFRCQVIDMTEYLRSSFVAKRFEMHLCTSPK